MPSEQFQELEANSEVSICTGVSPSDGRPLKFVSQLLGHRSVESTEVYTNVLTFDGAHFLEGVDFH